MLKAKAFAKQITKALEMRDTKKEETVLLVLSLKSATSLNSIITELLTEE